MKLKLKNTLFAITTSGLLLTACGGGNENAESTDNNAVATLSGNISVDGSSTVYPITEAVSEEFRNEAAEVKVTIGNSGSGAGFKKFSRGETDISDASRAIKDAEVEACKANNIDFNEVIVAYDGLSILVNKDNDWLNSITVEELKKLWKPAAEGTIMKWNQVNPAWPNEEIHLFGPSTAHGTYDYFTEEIMGKSGECRSDYTACADYNVMVQGLASDKLSLGYVGLAFYEENKDKLKLIPVDNGEGPITPNAETVANGTYKPLARNLYIYVKKSSIERPEVKAFVKYYLENAGELATEVGYIALPKEKYDAQLKEIMGE